ncbi:unnamed protein product [Leptosia nina]|uniref:Uncharacterized protein n=1 Tax=Leptosia nina TaxID=320188 RepID=A0AAV1ITC4_9NEOP
MHFKSLFLLSLYIVICAASDGAVESRGKKKKLALFVFLADIVLKKVFILKLVYAFIFWIIIHKAGYFLSWFVSYLKEQHHHHEYTPHFEHSYGPQFESSYGPYKRKSHGIH